MSETEEHRGSGAWRNFGPPLVAAIVGAIIGGIFIIVAANMSIRAGRSVPLIPQPTTTATVTATATATTTATATVTVNGDPAEESAGEREDIRLQQAVATQNCKKPGNSGTPWEDDVLVRIPGGSPSYAISCDITYAPREGSLDFLVPTAANTVGAVVTQDLGAENADLTVRFRITDQSGRDLTRPVDLRYGEKHAWDQIPIRGVSRVRFVAQLIDAQIDPREATGRFVIADPHFG